MSNTVDFKISGIDTARPPMIRKEPYIDVVFTLSEPANEFWCKNFNGLFNDAEYKASIDLKDCLFIKTWVRDMKKIPAQLEILKSKVTENNQIYNDRLIAIALSASNKNNNQIDEHGPQGQLNQIISQLDFD